MGARGGGEPPAVASTPEGAADAPGNAGSKREGAAGGPGNAGSTPQDAPGAPSLLLAGRVGRAHGLDGSFHVIAAVPALLDVGLRLVVAGRPREVVRRAGTDERPIVRLAGSARREDAEALRGEDLLAERAAAPALEEDEWWAEELEGCRVWDGPTDVGVVHRLVGLPSCEVLEVVRVDGRELLVPLVRDAVRSVDVSQRRIDVDLRFLGEAE